MATISTIKEAIMICRLAHITPYIWGHRGLGKSSLVQQLAVDNQWGFIDMRCSQLEASDLRGLPDRGEDGRTHYLPPADMPIGDMSPEMIIEELGEQPPVNDGTYESLEKERLYTEHLQRCQPRFQNGILFIDEVNRAQDDVLQAVFQLVLDGRVGQYVLPPGWSIVAAGNYMEGYMVSGFSDPAFLDRFVHLNLSGGETTLEEWIDYMSVAHGADAADVVEFASQNTKHLDGDITGELGFSIQPSRRSWEAVTRVMKVCNSGNFSESAKLEVLAGLIGRDLALSFTRYSCPVKPRSLINDGVKAHLSALKGLNRNQMTGLMWGLVSFAKNNIDDDKISEVCLDFASFIVDNANDKDLVVAFCRALVGDGKGDQDKARTAVISNPRLAEMMARFNKKSGSKKKAFVDRLVERPKLQQALSRVAWGSDDE